MQKLSRFACSFGGVAFVSVIAMAGCSSSGPGGQGVVAGDASPTTDAASSTDAVADAASEAATSETVGEAGPSNHSFDGAIAVVIDDPATNGTLVNATTKDYYKFDAKAGDRLLLLTSAQALASSTKSNGDDDTIIDTVLTVYDSTKKTLAQDDDDWPRTGRDSQLYFEAPADGTYYFTVEDCNSAFGGSACADATLLKTFAYSVLVAHTNKLQIPEINAASTQDGTTAHAQALTWKRASGGKAGEYGVTLVDGNLASTTATHVYSFTPPADTLVTAGTRAHAEFWLQPIGSNNGDGSTSNVKMWITDSSGTKIISSADETNFRDGDNVANGPLNLTAPVVPGQPYYLFVASAATTSKPATDYYFAEAFVGTYYYGNTEAEGPTVSGKNDTLATAEKLSTPSGATAGSYFVDGDLASPTDVDWFEVDPTSGTNTANFSCSAARRGSGIVGFTATLYDATGATSLGTIGPDKTPPTLDLFNTVTITTGMPKAYIKVVATAQSSTVTGTHYWCSVDYTTK